MQNIFDYVIDFDYVNVKKKKIILTVFWVFLKIAVERAKSK